MEVKFIRVEKGFNINDGNSRDNRLDIYLKIPYKNIGIEVKYLTIKVDKECNQEPYNLKNQGNTWGTRHAFLKDIQRLELLKWSHNQHQPALKIRKGFAILITNVPAMWQSPKGQRQELLSLEDQRTISPEQRHRNIGFRENGKIV